MSVLTRTIPVIFIGFFLSGCDDSNSINIDLEEVITLDVRLFLMKAEESPGLTSTLTDAEIITMMDMVNQVWRQANIQWNIVHMTTVQADSAAHFESIRSSNFNFSASTLKATIPDDTYTVETWDIFLLRDLGNTSRGGIYFSDITSVYQPEVDPNGGEKLDGGLVRILSHELGHSLGLRHVPCTSLGNLMAPGCIQGDRTRLGEDQISSTRNIATRGVPVTTLGAIN